MTLQLHSWEQALLTRAGEANEWLAEPMHDANPYPSELLDRAYALCEMVTAEHSRSFFMASGLLPPDKCRATRALYAFCRVTDDIVDNPREDVQSALLKWRRKVERGHFSADDLIAVAWTDTRHRYNVPFRYMTQLIDGVARDLDQRRYATFDDLAAYSYGVASTVGLMSMHIIGFENDEAVSYAIKLGVALQMTNILRDIGTDLQMGRVYLPQDELDAFGITEERLQAGLVDDRWRTFMRYQINRNRRLYDEAWQGIRLLHPDGRFAIAAASELYRAILKDIEDHDYDVFSRRAFVSRAGKLRRLPMLWLRTRSL